MSKRRIVLEIAGGMLERVTADDDLEVIVMDYDNIKVAESIEEMGPNRGSPEGIGWVKVDKVLERIEKVVSSAKASFAMSSRIRRKETEDVDARLDGSAC